MLIKNIFINVKWCNRLELLQYYLYIIKVFVNIWFKIVYIFFGGGVLHPFVIFMFFFHIFV